MTFSGQQRIVDVNPGEVNPCTGVAGTVTDDEFDHFHVTVLDDGTAHIDGGSVTDISFIPDDPGQPSFAGHETSTMTQSLSNNASTFTSTHRVIARSGDGSRIFVRYLSHLTLVGNQVIVTIERASLTCS